MNRLRLWISRLGGLVTGRRRDGDFAAELAAHLQLHVDDNLRGGMSPDAARRDALLRLGGTAVVAESHRDGRTVPIIQAVLRDVRYALRVLARTPSFSAAVIVVLALGIGANTAIFSTVNAVLLRPLPFEEPDRLVRLFQKPPQSAFPGIDRFSVSAGNFYDWKRDARLFAAMANYQVRQFALTGGKTAEAVVAGAVGADFFEVVRARPARGRLFRADEDAVGAPHVVIVSDRFWRSHLAAADDVIGRSLSLDGEPYTIVGVMPAAFGFRSWSATARDLWVPLAFSDEERTVRENHNAQVIARLRDGVDLRQAQAEMTTLSARLERDFPRDNAGWGATVVTLQEVIVGDIRLTLIMLLGAVALVLLIACANAGNLMFTRALARRKELAIRVALGAGRGRVLQQLFVEALLLALIAGAVGLLLAHVGLTAASTLLPTQLPRAEEISLDTRVLLFALAASLLTGILAGGVPALRSGGTDLNDVLKEGGRHQGAVGVRTRRLLIVGEISLSLVLLVGAGVMLRSLMALRSVDPGFNPTNVLTMHVSLPQTRYATAAQTSGFFDSALERLRVLPGVEAAGAVDNLPLDGGSIQPILLEGHAELLPHEQPTVAVRKITPGYLRAMGVPLLQGRDVTSGDTEVLLVSRSAAALLWPDADPIGRRITLPLQSRSVFKNVVGIVGDVKQGALSEAAAPTVYEYTREHEWRDLSFVLRTAVPPLSLSQPAAGVVHAIDPEQPVEDIRSMNDLLDETLTSQRFSALLLGVFAALALVLASVGIYTVLSYIVRGRHREIGIRIALGARTADVLRLVVWEGIAPALIGIAVGVGISVVSARLLEQLLFGVSAVDPLTLAAVASLLALVALAASVRPAYRASQIDSLVALRDE